MAKQKGILPIQGTIGNITFYKSADGYLVREKGGVDGNRLATDPAFQRTRENWAEFGKAGKAGKLLRTAFRSVLQHLSSKRLAGRMTREFMKVIKADATSERGMRNVIDGEAELLTGFEFNPDGKLSATLYASYTATIDRVTGELKVNIPSFIPANMIPAPEGATHFKIVCAGAEMDFENERYVANATSTAELPWSSTATTVIDLTNTITANSTHPLFIALGIEFYQAVNGRMYPLKNGAFNALAVVKVNGE